MTPAFAIGNRVRRKTDGRVGVVRAFNPDGDWIRVQFDDYHNVFTYGSMQVELVPAVENHEASLTTLMVEVLRHGNDLRFVELSEGGTFCEVQSVDRDEPHYYGAGIAASPLLALEAALADGGAAW
jgi:hypothetical protein